MRVTDYEIAAQASSSTTDGRDRPVKAPASFVATRLVAALESAGRPLCYVALSETAAERIAGSIRCLFPAVDMVVLPPWDCLPYDRVLPSRQCMGRRMDALRVWRQPAQTPRLLVTSLEALLQRIPPSSVIDGSHFELAVGMRFDLAAFEAFTERTGYIREGVADEPGELVIRDEVIDIFPAGGAFPMRIVLSDQGHVSELRSYDPATQRTDTLLETMVFGPASEAIASEGKDADAYEHSDSMERSLLRLYGQTPTVFDSLDDTAVVFAAGMQDRVEQYLNVIADARQAQETFGGAEAASSHSLYLDEADWTSHVKTLKTIDLDLDGGHDLPSPTGSANPRAALVDLARASLKDGRKVVMAGRGRTFETICRRVERATGETLQAAASWKDIVEAKDGSLLKLSCGVEEGFSDTTANVVLIVAGDDEAEAVAAGGSLLEPQLQIGDVVVHENHGIGILTDLESIAIDGTARDAARLEYRDGASILVPMEEFGKLWRYGSEPSAVTLDRLHTDAWKKKQAEVVKDIRSTARHLVKVAKEWKAASAEVFLPPRAAFADFVRRFPYSETPDQAAAIKAVLADLGSGGVMNRLVCGDVGFGKTEIALRAAAAVALCGGQVVVIAPTTVLARQHFATFERRFAHTGIAVAMLSRLVSPARARTVKAGLADGSIGVVIATQAILAKGIAFSRLGLLIVDEEHRFGLKEKRAMSALSSSLHTLTLSATPIPRTLQSAMVGVQDANLLTTAPSKRRPVRTVLTSFDRAAMRTALMREFRRGGQSFVVVPRIDDIDGTADLLAKIVPDLSVRIAHGKMPAADIDEAIVGFADGDGDILLSTNIIENGLDVPRANTMFIWRADLFGLAQLHQLRGRVGRARRQGMAYLLTEDETELAEETRLRLQTLVERDRLGSGLSISMRDLDLRGGGDLAGEDQTGHINVIGIGLYHKLLERALSALHRQSGGETMRADVNLGLAGTIPEDYVTDPAVRLNLYARLLRADAVRQVDALEEEFDDRFGELPEAVATLLRLTKLQIVAGRLGLAKLDAGPKALALTLTSKTPAKAIKALSGKPGAARREDRLVFEQTTKTGAERIRFFEKLLDIRA